MTPEQRKVYEEWVDTLPVKEQIRYSCDIRCMTSFFAGVERGKATALSAGVTDEDRAGWKDEIDLLPNAE